MMKHGRQVYTQYKENMKKKHTHTTIYKSFIHQKTGSIHTYTQKTQKTHLNKVNEHVTCSRISHGGRVEH